MAFKKIARVLGFTGIFLVICCLAGLVLAQRIEGRVTKEIINNVAHATQGRYRLLIEKSKFGLLNRSFSFYGVRLIPAKIGKGPHIVLSAPLLKLTGISFNDYFNEERVHALNAEILEPELKIYQSREQDSLPAGPVKIIPELDLFIGNIDVKRAKAEVYRAGTTSSFLKVGRCDIKVKEFVSGKKSGKNAEGFSVLDLDAEMKDIVIDGKSKLYTFGIGKIVYSLSDSIIGADSIVLRPRFSKKDFGKAAGEQASRVELTGRHLQINKVNAGRLISSGDLFAGSALITSLTINVYRDKNVQLKYTRRPSLQEIIRSLPLVIKVDTVYVENGEVTYEHLAKGHAAPGIISFSRVSATMSGLNSDTISGLDRPLLVFEGRSNFMNAAQLKLVYIFNLSSRTESFQCKGSLGSIDIKKANKMLAMASGWKISSGQLDSLRFYFKANDQVSRGWVNMAYHDLQVEKATDEKKSGGKTLSFLVNHFMVKNQNPGAGGRFRVGEIEYKRYPYKYFFYYSWKSLQSGIMSTMGIKSEVLLKRSDNS